MIDTEPKTSDCLHKNAFITAPHFSPSQCRLTFQQSNSVLAKPVSMGFK